eukprot:g173.t1
MASDQNWLKYTMYPIQLHESLQDIVENLWNQFPPLEHDDSNKRSDLESRTQLSPAKRHRPINDSKKDGGGGSARKTSRDYRPASGTANFAFLITLIEALDFHQEMDLTKTELMRRAESSGLSKSSIFGRDPILQRKIAQKTNSPIRLFSYSGWNSTKTLVNREVPLVEMFDRPRRVKLTQKGIQIARELREEAIEDGLISEDVIQSIQSSSMQETGAPAPVQKQDEPTKSPVEESETLELPFLDPDCTFDEEFEVMLVIDQREQFSRIANSSTAVKTASLSTEIFENFRVFKTQNYTETLQLYVQITQYITGLYKDQIQSIPMTSPAPSLDSFNVQLADKRKLKTKDVWGLFLTRIPGNDQALRGSIRCFLWTGIGPDSAASVVEKFPTPLEFYSTFCTTYENHIEKLSELSIFGGRKLGKVKATKIMNCLFPNTVLDK